MLNVGAGAPVGLVTVDHVYVRNASPPSSAPRTARFAPVPVPVCGEAVAACATVGAWLFTVTLACDDFDPAPTVTVEFVFPAWNNPPAVIDPPPVTDQLSVPVYGSLN